MADNYDPDNIRAKKHCRPPYGNEATWAAGILNHN
jgi:hypothetical protein